MCAVETDNVSLAQLLVDAKADVNVRNKVGHFILQFSQAGKVCQQP
jgi:ankyrin repeat protein